MAILKHREVISLHINALRALFSILLLVNLTPTTWALHPQDPKQGIIRKLMRPNPSSHHEFRLLSPVPLDSTPSFTGRSQTGGLLPIHLEWVHDRTSSLSIGIQRNFEFSSGFSLLPVLQHIFHRGSEIRAGLKSQWSADQNENGNLSVFIQNFYHLTFFKNENQWVHAIGLQWNDQFTGAAIEGSVHLLPNQRNQKTSPAYFLEVAKPLKNSEWSFLGSITKATTPSEWIIGIGLRWKRNEKKHETTENPEIRSFTLTSNLSTGKVLAYHDRRFLIQIDQGKHQGVLEGQEFDIYSAPSDITSDAPSERVAKAMTLKTTPNESILRVTEFFIPKNIEEGFEARPILR